VSILSNAADEVSFGDIWKAEKKEDGDALNRDLEAEVGSAGADELIADEPMIGEELGEEAFEFEVEGMSSGINNTKASLCCSPDRNNPRAVRRLPSTLIIVLVSKRTGFSGYTA
jgi:hypothetical protein